MSIDGENFSKKEIHESIRPATSDEKHNRQACACPLSFRILGWLPFHPQTAGGHPYQGDQDKTRESSTKPCLFTACSVLCICSFMALLWLRTKQSPCKG